MRAVTGLVLGGLMWVPAAQAVEDFGFICEKAGAEKRQIHVAYQTPASRLPCEVRYFKGEYMQVLWTSVNTPGYCEDKARGFADKQRGWGWQCREVIFVDAPEAEVAQ